MAVDPGMETGVVVLEFEGDTPARIVRRVQVTGGLDGLVPRLPMRLDQRTVDHVVCEKFRTTPRVYRAAELEALRIEGLVKTSTYWAGVDLEWQYPDSMLLRGSVGSRSENKRAADDTLRDMGLWTTGSQVSRPNANDVNSAMKHAVAFLRKVGHRPTLDALGVS